MKCFINKMIDLFKYKNESWNEEFSFLSSNESLKLFRSFLIVLLFLWLWYAFTWRFLLLLFLSKRFLRLNLNFSIFEWHGSTSSCIFFYGHGLGSVNIHLWLFVCSSASPTSATISALPYLFIFLQLILNKLFNTLCNLGCAIVLLFWWVFEDIATILTLWLLVRISRVLGALSLRKLSLWIGYSWRHFEGHGVEFGVRNAHWYRIILEITLVKVADRH